MTEISVLGAQMKLRNVCFLSCSFLLKFGFFFQKTLPCSNWSGGERHSILYRYFIFYQELEIVWKWEKKCWQWLVTFLKSPGTQC